MLIGKKEKLLLHISIWSFILLQILYVSFWGGQKINYHVDEYYTYGLSNNRGSIWPSFENGVPYEGDSIFLDYLAPDKSERFDYSIVWDNQAADVHPPLYYALIHTICSFSPNAFNKWAALSLNIVLLIVVDLLVFFIAKLLLRSPWGAFCTMAINGMTLLTVNTTLFLRMYMLMTVFVLGITYLFLKYWKEKHDWKFYIMLFMLSLGGALTQYYFLIYLFSLCIVFGIIRILQKRWKEVLFFLLTLGGAGCASVIIFPAMLEQIFGNGYRGQQAFENATAFSDAPKHILQYFQIINRELFGGFILLVMLFVVSCLAIFISKKKKKCDELSSLCLLLMPTIFYCIVIALIAPYQYNRYIMAIGPLFVLAAIWFMLHVIWEVCKRRNMLLSNLIVVGIFSIMICSSMSLTGWMPEYTYQSTKERLENAATYSDSRVLYVNIAAWAVNDNMQELIKYKDFTFIDENQLTDYIKQWDDENLVLYAPSGMDVSSIISSIETETISSINVKPLYKNKHPDFASVYYLDFVRK